MKAPSPAFSFYPKDWLSDANVRAMTHEERGIYIDLLAHYWLEGGLPAGVEMLARLVGMAQPVFNRCWRAVQPVFRKIGSRLVQGRLQKEVEKQFAFKKSQSEKGRKSAQARSSRGGNHGQPRLNPVGVRLRTKANRNQPSVSVSVSVPSEPLTAPPPPPAPRVGAHGAARFTLDALVTQAAQYSADRGIPAFRGTRRRFRDWFRAGLTWDQVRERIDAREHLPRAPL